MKNMIKIVSLVLTAVLLVGLAAGCQDNVVQTPSPVDSGTPGTTEGKIQAEQSFTHIDSYESLYELINTANNSSEAETGMVWDVGGSPTTGSALDEASTDFYNSVDTGRARASMSEGEADYSKTNVQVEGIDESDIVKTDGSYIYILKSDSNLVIAKASGAETSVLSTTPLIDTDTEQMYYSGLYIMDNLVAMVGDYYNYDTNNSQTRLIVYDVSEPSNPELIYEVGQDGNLLTSRLLGGTIYLVSNYMVYSAEEDNPETYVPSIMDADGETRLVSVNCITILQSMEYTDYNVVSAYDIASGETLGTESLLGGYGTVYMNESNLYLAIGRHEETQGESYTEGVYTVTDYTSEQTTHLVRFDLTSGAPKQAATGTVPGYLNDQFSLDEYNGYLRLVVTDSSSSWKTYEDKARGFINYDQVDDSLTNALYVLDNGLNTVGNVKDLAEDETVYSARFEGDIGYFVTFRQVDPLFAVDLSNPANPTVLSALKIPGFSEYLHIYGEGRLFGLGMNADADTGSVSGMKLSMFSTENPADVTEKHTLTLDTSNSSALYNHKAILISPERDIIAFPADSGYRVYGYSDDDGFYPRAEINTEDIGYDARGLYIGDTAYIVGQSVISVLDMSSFSQIAHITF